MPPVYIAKFLGVKIPVHKNGKGRYCIRWRPNLGAPPLRETFGQKSKATERADEIARGIGKGLADVLTLTHAERDSYRAAVQTLSRLGIPLHTAIEEYTAAKVLLPAGATLLDAATAYQVAATRPVVPPSKEILAAFLAQLADDHRSAVYIRGLRHDLTKFAAAFPKLELITPPAVRAYLGAVRRQDGVTPISARRRDNIRNGIVTLCRFAVAAPHHLPRALAEQIGGIPQIALPGSITTLDPEQYGALLADFAQHETDWLPWVALAGFAGLRTSEVFRMEWRFFKWTRESIAVPHFVAHKVHISRHAPLTPALAAWLAPWRNASGRLLQPVIDALPDPRPARASALPTDALSASPARTERALEKAQSRALARACQRLGWPAWGKGKHNALRHSFGSHRLAILNNIASLALEMGNSPKQIREHYNDSKDPIEAEAYFALRPAAGLLPARKIIPMNLTA